MDERNETVTNQHDLRASVTVRTAVEKPTACFQQVTAHFDVMVTEVAQQGLQAVERFGLWENAELDQFTDETHGFDLRFDVDLIFAFDVRAKLVLQQAHHFVADLGHHGVELGNQSRVERQQMEIRALHGVERFDQPFTVLFGVQIRGEITRCLQQRGRMICVENGLREFVPDRSFHG